MKRHLFRRMGRFLRPQASSLAGAAALAALSGLLALGGALLSKPLPGLLGGGGHRDWAGGCGPDRGAAVLCRRSRSRCPVRCLQLRRLRRPGAGGADRILHIAEGSFSANHSATGPVF